MKNTEIKYNKFHETCEIKYYRYIYKIKCLSDNKEWKNKYYIGQHSTNNMDDGYAGSGVKINEYYKKFGKIEGVTYEKIILKDNIKTETDLDKYERQYIEKELGKKKCLNISEGGGDFRRRRKKEANIYLINEDYSQQRINNVFEDNTIKDNTIEDNTIKDNTIEDNTIEDNTIKDNTIKDNTIKDKNVVIEKYDKTTEKLLLKLKKNKDDFELRKELILRLGKYGVSPAILGIV